LVSKVPDLAIQPWEQQARIICAASDDDWCKLHP